MKLADLNPVRSVHNGVTHVHFDCPCLCADKHGCGYKLPPWTEEGAWPDVTVGGSLKVSGYRGEAPCAHFHIVKGEIVHCGDVPHS